MIEPGDVADFPNLEIAQLCNRLYLALRELGLDVPNGDAVLKYRLPDGWVAVVKEGDVVVAVDSELVVERNDQ